MMERRAENRWEYGRLHRKNVLFSLMAAILITALVLGFFFQGTQIADEGMAPVLRAGDVILFSRLSKFLRTPQRGDVYAAYIDGALRLGRIVGLPGECVQIDKGNVYINGIFLDENAYAQYADTEMPETKMEDAEYFLLPDCREYMLLSPANMRIKADDLRGRAFLRVAPFKSAGLFA